VRPELVDGDEHRLKAPVARPDAAGGRRLSAHDGASAVFRVFSAAWRDAVRKHGRSGSAPRPSAPSVRSAPERDYPKAVRRRIKAAADLGLA
jgi:hypothetical protein